MNRERIVALLDRARAQGLECIVIMPGPNLRYLTGLVMHLSERPTMLFFPVFGEPFVVCPAFEAERITAGSGVTRLFPWGEEEGPAPVLRKALAGMGVGGGVMGVEYRYMRVLERELLAQSVDHGVTVMGGPAGNRGLRYEDVGLILADLRATKDEGELALLQKAATLVDAGCEAAHRFIRPGVTERQVAEHIEQELERLGAKPPYHIAVASGPRAAIPHAGATDRTLQEGELCWVDLVCRHEGYVADITRTYPVGQVEGQLREIFTLCLEAQARARAEARPGMTGAQVDAIARDHIAAGGYGEFFTHRTGHGLGLEGHEEPYIVGSNHRPLQVGQTFTIEPGIYLPGIGGVRIEDDVVLEADGARSLTRYQRELL